MNFSAVILAGGRSSRMGRDKAFLEFEGRTLLVRQIELVREAGAREVFISGRANTDYSGFSCAVLLDGFQNGGPLAGIERALNACSTPLLLVLAVDVPNMTVPLLRSLAMCCAEDMGAIPCTNGRIQPLTAFYPKSARPLAVSLLSAGVNAATHFAEQCVKEGLAMFSEQPCTETACFANWNKPVDIAN